MEHDNKQSIRYSTKLDESQEQSTNPSVSAPTIDTAFIANDITVSGDLCGTGDVMIEGTVIGKIKLNGNVTVAETGFVKGQIFAVSVYVAGSVEGNIATKECLRLKMTGSVTGDVVVGSFIIEDGANFNGRSHMTKPGEEPVIEY